MISSIGAPEKGTEIMQGKIRGTDPVSGIEFKNKAAVTGRGKTSGNSP